MEWMALLLFIAVIAILLAFVLTGPAPADVLEVPRVYPTIQIAINAAQAGDEIEPVGKGFLGVHAQARATRLIREEFEDAGSVAPPQSGGERLERARRGVSL